MSIATYIHITGTLGVLSACQISNLDQNHQCQHELWYFRIPIFFVVGCISDFPNFSFKKCEFLSMEMGRGKPPVEFVTDPVGLVSVLFTSERYFVIRVPRLGQPGLVDQLQKSHVDDNWRLIIHWLPWEPSDSSRSHRMFSRVSHNSKVSFLEDLREISWDGSLTSCCPKAARFWVWPGYNI